jgi:hypothetical protein
MFTNTGSIAQIFANKIVGKMHSWDLSWEDPYSEIIMLFYYYTVKKRLTTFPSPAGMSLT